MQKHTRFGDEKINYIFWIFKKIRSTRKKKASALSKRSRTVFLKHKEQARFFIRERIEYFNNFYGFSFGKISIRNQKTRWGSCSRRGSLNFNYKILMLPQPLADYIIVHELCHLGEFNHSKDFWSLVAQTTPNYREAREALKRHRI